MNADHHGAQPESSSRCDQMRFDAIQFNEEAAVKNKEMAWSQTTWLLAINTGILGYSVHLYVEDRETPGLIILELLAAGVGCGLCSLSNLLLGEIERHIQNAWNRSRDLIHCETGECFNGWLSGKSKKKPASDQLETPESSKSEKKSPVDQAENHESIPFIDRLRLITWMFLVAHLTWLVVVFYLVEIRQHA